MWVLLIIIFECQPKEDRRKLIVASVTHMSKKLNECCWIQLCIHWKDALTKMLEWSAPRQLIEHPSY